MRTQKRISLLFLLLSLGMMIFSSCSSKKDTGKETPEAHALVAVLLNDLNDQYIRNTYSNMAQIEKVMRISRSENKWQVDIISTASQFDALIKSMELDKNITFVSKADSELGIKNSTNSGQTKTSPVNK